MSLNSSPLYTYMAIFGNISAIFEFLLVIFFTYQQLIKHNSAYTSVYYILLNTGYAVSSWWYFWWFLSDILADFYKPIQYIPYANDVYYLFFLGFWNFIIGLFRCTALAFPLKHEKIWSGKQLYITILVLLFPFIIFGHAFTNPYCIIHIYDEECQLFAANFFLWLLATCLPLSILTFISIIAAVIKVRCQNISTSKTAVENRLILQTFLTIFFQIIFYIFMTANFISSNVEELIGISIALLALVFVHYSNILVLFFVCTNLRNDVLKFYGLKCFIKGTKPLIITTKTTAVVHRRSTVTA